ncbi:tetratricopeptide repeat protein [Mycolicibacterium alvei]|uniref:Mce associated membrane protein n=1 Tax=Mycolicibacterium alvei TaxID=67081 RepID=A0A6N4UTV8_9MYCO|nr:tetratricopeptide repeat protein [Mycolicibacterium alvei]MCV7000861.1 mammalian cell entry protein [Mycolicibacterium alvei]BBX27094.1 Mce associated membrane protein [Mycolicibacterium alvei]
MADKADAVGTVTGVGDVDELVVDSDAATDDGDGTEVDAADNAAVAKGATSPLRLALIAGLIGVVALGGLTGWLGFRAHQSQQAKEERELYLQVARQGALNLTTIDYQNVDSDVQRILDSATGQFHDDFSQRAEPFVDVVKKAQSKSVGTVTDAGLESVTGDEAQAIVAVTVKTSNIGVPEQQPRSWRMRMTVQKVGEGVKVSNVGFVA